MSLSVDEALRTRFGLESFRPWQREAIDAVLEGPKRVLVVAPTGGGKSLTYQLPATMLGGTTLVISPLVALMEDQVRALLARGISATFLASTLDVAERRERESDLLRGRYELVYAAPERLASDAFVDLLVRAKLSLVAVDEAHCIAQWGHDFRPDYLRIGALLERVKPERVLACTATATPSVRDEIVKQLGFDRGPHHVVLRGFARPNLHLAAQNVGGPKEARAALFATLKDALGSPSAPKGAAIVYAATRKSTEEYAKLLEEKAGWNAAAYHAGMNAETRTKVADAFAARKLDVVVATNAFGMGIDRADIRAVVHVQPPSSIEAYYQEVGRAGRDGAEASGLLLCSGSDISLRRRLMSTSDDWALFRELLRYIDARSCRHDFVLRYFGDEHELLGGCGHCDVCLMLDEEGGLSADDVEQTTIMVKKALSAVARAQKRGGLVAIAEMLHGDETEKTKKFGFTALSTFGLLRDRSLDWVVALLRALLAAGWIDLTQTEHPVPFLTRAGAAVMKGEAAARIVLPPEPKAKRERTRREPRSQEAPMLDAEARPLFERLRAHRAAIAKERGVPAYVIAFDRTLVEMATHRPHSRGQLMGIYGMGPSRVEAYGDGFLAVIGASS